ncbi:MAG: sulfatase-like hydrolase/transferase [Chitinophagales bacterium]
MRKHNIIILFFCVCLVLHTQAQTEKPNFLFVIVDDLNDYIEGYQGHQQTLTPNLLELQSSGVTFLNGFCNAPGCAPSRTSMLSGKDLEYTQVYKNEGYNYIFRENFTIEKNNAEVFTLPEILKDSGGYYTYAINKIFHNDSHNDYDNITSDGCAKNLSWNRMHTFNEDLLLDVADLNSYNGTFDWGAIADSLEPYLEDVIVADSAISFIHNYASGTANTCDKPFFLALGLSYPHGARYVPHKYFLPYYTNSFFEEPFVYSYNHPADANPYNGVLLAPQPEPPYADYEALPEGGIAQGLANMGNFYENLELYLDTLSMIPILSDTLSSDERKNILSLTVQGAYAMAYLAAVRFADYQLGRIVAALQSYPELMENTIIVVVSDHGFSLGEKRHWTKWSLWDTDLRIPFIIVHPDAQAGAVSYNSVSLLDIFPTVCSWSNTAVPHFTDGTDYLDGVDISDIVENPELVTERPVLATTKNTGGAAACFPFFSVRNKQFHYIQYRWNNDGSFQNSYCDTTTRIIEEELYDVGEKRENDGNEWNNLASDANYHIVKKYLQQWFPGNTKYNERTYAISINEETANCVYQITDTLRLQAQIFDIDGNELSEVPIGKHLVWLTSIHADTVFDLQHVLALSDIPSVASGEKTLEFLYLVLYNSDYSVIEGLALKKIALENDASASITFDAYAIDQEVFITNIHYPEVMGSITWDFGDGYTFTGNEPPAHLYTDTGTYMLACTAFLQGTDTCLIQASQSITLGSSPYVITIYPNPASELLLVHFSPNIFEVTLTITDITGKVLIDKYFEKQTIETLKLDVSEFESGMYVIQLKNAELEESKLFEVMQ